MSEYVQVATYPSVDQLTRWERHCTEMGFRSRSAFVEAMVEAGLKKFDAASVEPDETLGTLRQQRNDLKAELDRARDRIDELETAVYHGERRAIAQYVQTDPGATYDEIIQHIMNTVPERVTSQLDDLEGTDLRVESGRYYPQTDQPDHGGQP